MIDASLLAELQAITGRLAEPAGMLEARVGAIGERLCAAVEVLGSLTATFEAVRGGLERPEMSEAVGDLSRTTASVAAMAERIPVERGHLERLGGSFGGMNERIGRMSGTVKTIEVLVVNARIAAAYLGEQEAEMSVFTREVSRLAASTRGTIEQFAAGQRRLAALLQAAQRDHGRFEQQNLGRLHEVARSLQAGVAEIGMQRGRMAATAGDIGARTRQIGQQVGNAVTALQVGDRTCQRIAHVSGAVALLTGEAGTADALPDWHAGLTPSEQRQVAAAVCRLQAAQLADTLDQFESELRRVIGALERLAVDAGELVRLGAGLYGTQGGTEEEPFVTRLAREIGEAERLMRTCAAGRAEFDRVSAEMAGVLEGLLREADEIERIEIDMRLAGLNTVLKCGRLGQQGAALRVIAEELNGSADETVREAQEVIAGMRGVRTEAARLGGEATAQDAATMRMLEERTAASVRLLETVGAGLVDALGALRQEGGRLESLLHGTVGGISIHGELRGMLREPLDALTRMAATPPAAVSDGAACVRERILGVLRDRYSMADERHIHDPGARSPAAAPAGEVEIDDLLF